MLLHYQMAASARPRHHPTVSMPIAEAMNLLPISDQLIARPQIDVTNPKDGAMATRL